ncbi:hypothetical protein F5887DRAFT_1203710 [Amanita rubescens]|nr:hypothetical protein F5887DRAFT_1203710 [Amanita rubescens]
MSVVDSLKTNIRSDQNDIDKTKRISAQEDLVVCKVIRYVVKEFPELKTFHNGWPIRELIRQYLSNRVSYEKKLQEGMAAEERRERGYSYGNERLRRLVNYAYYSPSERSAETSDEESSSDHDGDAAPTRKSNMTDFTENEKLARGRKKEARGGRRPLTNHTLMLDSAEVGSECDDEDDAEYDDILFIAPRNHVRKQTNTAIGDPIRLDHGLGTKLSFHVLVQMLFTGFDQRRRVVGIDAPRGASARRHRAKRVYSPQLRCKRLLVLLGQSRSETKTRESVAYIVRIPNALLTEKAIESLTTVEEACLISTTLQSS